MSDHVKYFQELRTAILAHAEDIAKIWDGGGIAVFVHDDGPPHADLDACIRGLGGAPGKTVFRMSAAARKRWIADPPDAATHRWVSRTGTRRVFVIGTHALGNFLLNLDEKGWYTEPGSLDNDRKGGAS